MPASLFDAVGPWLTGRKRILLISHVAPDGDALGSMLGLKALLDAQGHTVTAANQDGVPSLLRSDLILPGWQQVIAAPFKGRAGRAGYELAIALDCSDLQRLGTIYNLAPSQLPLLVIDHHVTNTRFGSLNIVDPAATSTAEIVCALADALGWPFSASAAQCLLTGIATDTRGFRISGVTATLLGLVQRLMEAGASLHAVSEGALDRRNLDTICLWGQALSTAQLHGKILWTAIPLTMRSICGDKEQSDSGLANFLAGAEEADVAVIFTERERGKIDVGMRSVHGFNVAEVALSLGGGGHPRAAGCNLAMSLEYAIPYVLGTLEDALAAQSSSPAERAQ